MCASSARHQGGSVQFHNSVPNEVMGGEADVRVKTELCVDIGQEMLYGGTHGFLGLEVVLCGIHVLNFKVTYRHLLVLKICTMKRGGNRESRHFNFFIKRTSGSFLSWFSL